MANYYKAQAHTCVQEWSTRPLRSAPSEHGTVLGAVTGKSTRLTGRRIQSLSVVDEHACGSVTYEPSCIEGIRGEMYSATKVLGERPGQLGSCIQFVVI